MQAHTDSNTRIIRQTTGICPECHRKVPAAVLVRDNEVLLEKRCDRHGNTAQLLSRNPEYWEGLDRYYFSVIREPFTQRDYLVRMTERCNLDCPICLAKANTEGTLDLDLSGLEQLLEQRRGIKIDLMSAEPTVRPDLEEWIRKVKATGNIAALHTNGLKLADDSYVRRIKQAGVDEVFLQFDGFDDDAHKVLRGRPLLETRLKALENLRRHRIATSLIVVIARGLNDAQVGETFRFALKPENDHIREVFFLGLRLLGSARDAARAGNAMLGEQQLMPDELLDMLSAQEPGIRRSDVYEFNRIYFALLSAFKVKKCLYIQHYMVTREAEGGYAPISRFLDMKALGRIASRYARRMTSHPNLARADLLLSLVRQGIRKEPIKLAASFFKLERLLKSGMNLRLVPQRFLLLGFITACDPYNFDAQVATNCGKGELSVDGGFTESGGFANVEREARFEASDRRPGTLKRDERADAL